MKACNLVNRKHGLVGFQWRHGNPVSRKQTVFVSMAAWKSRQHETACLGFNEGTEILSTGNRYCFSFHEGIDVLPTGKQTVWVPIKVWESCQYEKTMFEFQWRYGNPFNRWTQQCLSVNDGMAILSTGNNHCLGFNDCMEILSTGKRMFGLQCRHGILVNRKQRLVGFQWGHGNRVNRKTNGWLSMTAWKFSQ